MIKTNLKKLAGALLIIFGIILSITPVLPGFLFLLFGLELWGIRLVSWKKIKIWFRKYGFWQTK